MKFYLPLLLVPLSLFSINVAIIGDSISVGYGATNKHGYVEILKERYRNEEKNVNIINRSYAGATTDTGDQIVVDLITKKKIDYLVINLGLVDSKRNISQENFLSNLDLMICKSQQMGARVILGGVSSLKVNQNYQSTLDIAYAYLIQNRNVQPYYFLTKEIVVNHSPDGIHPNDVGHQLIADELYKQLEIAGVK